MRVTSIIKTDRPHAFASVSLASGIGVAPFAGHDRLPVAAGNGSWAESVRRSLGAR
jgi:hypothetical protein